MAELNKKTNDCKITTHIGKDRSKDKIIMSRGGVIVIETPAIIFDKKQKQILLELIG